MSDPTASPPPPEDAAEEDPLAGAVLYAEQVEPQPGLWGFTIREIGITVVWIAAFALSFIPLGAQPVWGQGIQWILTIGLPTVSVFLLILRRLSPSGIRRVGSLGIDQFASVAFSVAAVVWAQFAWQLVTFSGVLDVPVWLVWTELALFMTLVILTVLAPFLPVIGDDFRGRQETLAHRAANPVRPVVATRSTKPVPEPGAIVQVSTAAEAATDAEVVVVDRIHVPTEDETEVIEPLEVESSEAFQSFWVLSPELRPVVDDSAEVMFEIGPTEWALVIEDRGGAYVIRHDDGRVGFLHDVSDLTRS